MIYLFDRSLSDCAQTLARATALLPPFRQEKANRFTDQTLREQSVLAYLLLVYGLRREYQIHTLPIFSYHKHGKPFLRDYPAVHFSLTHCRAGAACALSTTPVGLDMQDIRANRTAVFRRVCNEEEQRLILESPDPAHTFTEIWTKKESLQKLTGRGIACDLKAIDTLSLPDDCHTFTRATDRYVLTCIKKAAS